MFFLLLATLVILTPLLGNYLARLYEGKIVFLGKIERAIYRFSGIDPNEEMSWKGYLKALFFFNLYGFLFLLAILLLQKFLPLNPQGLDGLSFPLAFNTAVSFVTGTNWQAYSGESTMSYFSQTVGITTQNFLSPATGMGALLTLVRGLSRKSSETVGNFWVDLVRTVLYVLLPLSVIFAIVLVSQGVIQNFAPYVKATTLEGAVQLIPMGPAASQVAIKQLGTNGGGFFGANSAHPFENPTGVTNFLQMVAILLIPAATVYAYGVMIHMKRQAWVILGVMSLLLGCGVALALYFEDPFMMEGKEVRFGVASSVLWSALTTATSNGSVNAMLSSLSPIAGGVAMFNIMLGEIIFGGVGVGLCAMLMFVLLTVFISGLMVGRTPEYLGKKIEKREMQWLVLAILLPGALILLGSGISSVLPSMGHSSGPHGLSEVLYAFSSAAGNNGSAFEGLNTNTVYYNFALASVMLVSRVAILVPTVAIAGSLAKKRITPTSSGTLSTGTFLFGFLLLSIILLLGALSFFPALSLGPIVEQFLTQEGRTF